MITIYWCCLLHSQSKTAMNGTLKPLSSLQRSASAHFAEIFIAVTIAKRELRNTASEHRSWRAASQQKNFPWMGDAFVGSMHSKVAVDRLASSFPLAARTKALDETRPQTKMKNEYLADESVCAVPNHLLKYTSAVRRAAINRRRSSHI